jgi:hypothetical protein
MGNNSPCHYPDFGKLVKELEKTRGESISTYRRVESGDYLFLPGDIVIINPGVNNEIPSANK